MLMVDAELKANRWVLKGVRIILDKGERLPNVLEVENILRKIYRTLPRSTSFMKIIRLDDFQGGSGGG